MEKTDHIYADSLTRDMVSVQKSLQEQPNAGSGRPGVHIRAIRVFWLLIGMVFMSVPAAVYAQTSPVANDDEFKVRNDGDSYIYVLLNDEVGDHPIDPGSIEIVSPPAHADTLVLESPGVLFPDSQGALIYQLGAATSETSDSFTYRVRDAEGNVSNTATVTIDIIEAFDFTTDSFHNMYIGEGVSPQIDLTDFTIYPGGVDESTIELLEVSDSEGAVINIENGILTYQHPSPLPDPEFFEFRYVYTIQSVDGTYSPPVTHWLTFSELVNVPFTVNAGVKSELNVVEHFDNLTEDDLLGISDFRIDGQSITILQDPAKGTAISNPEDAFLINYTANPDAGGSDEFIVRGLSDFSDMPVAIYKVQLDIFENNPPVLTSVIDEETVTEGEEIIFQFEADDPEGDDLTFTLTAGEGVNNASLTAEGLFSFAPEAGQAGEYPFTIQVSDGVLTDEHPFIVYVLEEGAPVANDDEFNVWNGGDSHVYVLLNDEETSDPIDPLSIEIIDFPEHADGLTVGGSGNGEIIYELSANPGVASDSFTYRISDTEGRQSNIATVTLNLVDAFNTQTVFEGPNIIGEGLPLTADLNGYLIYPLGFDFDTFELLASSDPSLSPENVDAETGILTYNHPDPLSAPDNIEDTGEFFSLSYTFTVQNGDEIYSPPVTKDVVFTPFANESVQVAEGSSVVFNAFENYEAVNFALGGDFPVDPATIVIVEGPGLGTAELDSEDQRIVEYTADPGVSGTDELILSGKGRESDINSTTLFRVMIEVTESPNEPPAFTSVIDEETVTEAEEFTFQFEADDPDGDDLTFTLTAGGDVNNASLTAEGLFSFAPEAGQAGEYPFTVQVGDGELTVEHDFTITVQEEPNEPPVFTSTPVTIVQVGDLYRYEIEANDPDGDPIVLSAPVLPEWLEFTDNSDGTGVLEGTPAASDLGEHVVELQAGDGTEAAVQEFTIDVREEPNEPPALTATFEEETIQEGEEFSFQFEAEDPDGDDLIFTLTAGGDVDNASLTTEGLFSFAPEAGQQGSYEFTVEVSDGESSDDHMFTVLVEEVPNNPPVFIATFDEDQIFEGETLTFQFGAGDPDDDTLVFTLATGGDTDNAGMTESGLFTFSPEPGQAGVYEFTVEVSDGEFTVDHEFTVEVLEEPNEPPVFTTIFDEETVVEGEEFSFQFEAEDPDGDDLSFSLTVGEETANVSLTENGLFRFAPEEGKAGNYEFVVQVSDGELTNEHRFVVIVEEPPNEPPVFITIFDEETVVEGEEFSFQFEAEDPEGDTLTFTLTEGEDVENATLSDEGLFVFVPDFEQAGEYGFTVEVSDGELSATHRFLMTVEEGNRAPEARDIIASTRINISFTIDLTEFISDPDGDPLGIENVSDPQQGRAVLEENRVTYTPALNFTGTDNFEYTVADGRGGSATGLVTIDVLGLAFQVTDLGLAAGENSRAFDISDEGHVTGIITRAEGTGSAFLWKDGELDIIPELNQVFGVNDSGNLAGIAGGGGAVLPAMYLNGVLTRGTTMGGNFGALYDINNDDTGVGVADDASGTLTGFLWDENGQQPVVPDNGDLQLYSINDAGVLAGFVQLNNQQEQAVRVLSDGTVQLLSSGSGTGSRAFGAGNGGHIAGVIFDGTAIRGAAWQNGSVQELPGLGGSATIAYGVNNSGVIVGTSGTISQKRNENADILDQMTGFLSGKSHREKEAALKGAEAKNAASLARDEGLRAVIWTGSEITDLNDVIPSGSGWELVEARAINNHMNIVGYGRLNGEVRAFLLTPAEVEDPVAGISVQQVTGGKEAVVDLWQQVENTYGRTTVTEIWGASYGAAELRQERYLHYTAGMNIVATADTVHYRVVDQRGAVAEGEVVFELGELSESFELSQNYPNPFNSSTVIPFKLAENGRVVVELYSISGRKIAVLMDQALQRGTHRAELGNLNLSSGIYFYRLRVINASGKSVFTETRKMSLVK